MVHGQLHCVKYVVQVDCGLQKGAGAGVQDRGGQNVLWVHPGPLALDDKEAGNVGQMRAESIWNGNRVRKRKKCWWTWGCADCYARVLAGKGVLRGLRCPIGDCQRRRCGGLYGARNRDRPHCRQALQVVPVALPVHFMNDGAFGAACVPVFAGLRVAKADVGVAYVSTYPRTRSSQRAIACTACFAASLCTVNTHSASSWYRVGPVKPTAGHMYFAKLPYVMTKAATIVDGTWSGHMCQQQGHCDTAAAAA